jgi:uncharacterized protein (TIGR03435 family)
MTFVPRGFSQESVACPGATGLFAAFDVVAVKPAHLAARSGLRDLPDGLYGNATVEGLVRAFYLFTSGITTGGSANDDMIIGLPEWTKNDLFSIQAKMSPEQATAFAKLSKDQRQKCQETMVRAMLADQFAFKMHRQPRQVPAYELTVAKGGPRVKPGVQPDRAMSIQPVPDSYELTLQAYSMSMKQLTNLLAVAYWGVGRNVSDATGLVGKYSFALTFAPTPRTISNGEPANSPADNSSPSIFNALEDQLGLHLQNTTATYGIVVVDHVERPAAN